MQKHMNAKSLVKVGKYCTLIYKIVRPMAAVHALVAVSLGVLSAVFQSTELLHGTLCFIPFPVVTLLIFILGRQLHKSRTINGTTYSAEMYALITDELRSQKITTNTTRFIQEHPDHERCAQELGKELKKHKKLDLTTVRTFKSFLFSSDKPEQAKEALLTIINERGITDPYTAKEMLQNFTETESSLMSGAL